MPFPPLLGANATDPISGGAGWIGAGLLGAVLAWLLLKHLPSKDEQIRGFIEDKDKTVAAMRQEQRELLDRVVAKHVDAQKELRADYRESLQEVVKHCSQEIDQIASMLRDGLTTLDRSLGTLARSIDEMRTERERRSDVTPRGNKPASDQGSNS